MAVLLLVGGWSASRVLFGSPTSDSSAARAALLTLAHGGNDTDASRSAYRTEPGTVTGSPTATPSPTTMRVTKHGPGTFVVVPGRQTAPDNGAKAKRMTVRVEVEKGTDVDLQAFAAQVMQTLNDPRSWGHGGTLTFARTDAKTADIRVMLASPDTSERMCKPLQTHGVESCSIGNKAILTSYRWANATKEFPNVGIYREYVVNHEVGHVLGHHHQQCGGKGEVAPVMQQQTIRVAPCTPNGWPFP